MRQHPFRLTLSLASTATLALASLPFGLRPVAAQEAKTAQGTTADLGVMSISLKDVIQPNFGFQGALQGAGTPNQAGIGGFIPLHVGNNSVAYVDVLVNANFSDYNGLSSIGTTKVAGTTISTSTRLGYRWLNNNRSWMFGVNAGYDSRPMNTGGTDNGIPVTDSQAPFFQQVALNLEAKSDKFTASAYGLVPVGKYGAGTGNVAVINDSFIADNLSTYGIDFGYKIMPNLKLALGTYYQLDEKEEAKTATGVGVKTGLTFDITNEIQAGVVYSYDENFQSKVTGNLKWRFGGGSKNKKTESLLAANPVIQALSATPENRDVRVANCYVRNRNADGSFQRHFWSWNCFDGIGDNPDILLPFHDPRRNVGWAQRARRCVEFPFDANGTGRNQICTFRRV
ncbi:carbamoyl-phosphate synthase [Synechococcus sp. UW140]|uniref:carbamoyl-phosphate synthase n=1 Tax=Synechococcus sp. UW140 TaxID=368503 RepID=UPI003137CBD1